MFSVNIDSDVGNVRVKTTSNRGLSSTELADMAMRKLIHVSESAPEPIRSQAMVFRDRTRNVLEDYMRQAQSSERTNIIAELEQQGMTDLADIIRRL